MVIWLVKCCRAFRATTAGCRNARDSNGKELSATLCNMREARRMSVSVGRRTTNPTDDWAKHRHIRACHEHFN
jgi:hypothetical protein